MFDLCCNTYESYLEAADQLSIRNCSTKQADKTALRHIVATCRQIKHKDTLGFYIIYENIKYDSISQAV